MQATNAAYTTGLSMESPAEVYSSTIEATRRRRASNMIPMIIIQSASKCVLHEHSYAAGSNIKQELYQCGKDQGIDIRPAAQGGDIKIGDMLFVRSGFIEAYHSKSPDERNALAVRPHEFGINDGQRWAGLSQEERMIDWLHDCYFATVAGDAPAFEAWPSHERKYPISHQIATESN